MSDNHPASVAHAMPSGGMAVIVGASGGIGHALQTLLETDARFHNVAACSRGGDIPLDLTAEASIEAAARVITDCGTEVRLIIDATGVLEGDGCVAEKTWRQLDAVALARAFAINAIGPALLMKHFLPLLPRSGKAVFATLSARVGSIGDNRLGGWYSYRASKAALNQLVHTAAIELRRTRPEAICVAMHPGTVATRLSSRFAKSGLDVQTAATAAARILQVIDTLEPATSGGFFDQQGRVIAW